MGSRHHRRRHQKVMKDCDRRWIHLKDSSGRGSSG